MNNRNRILVLILFAVFMLLVNTGCKKKTYQVTFMDEENVVTIVNVTKGELIENYEIKKNNYQFLGWFENETLFDFNTPITDNLILNAKWELIPFVAFKIDGVTTINHGSVSKLNIEYETLSDKVAVEWQSSDEKIAEISNAKASSCRVTGVKPGVCDVTATYSENNQVVYEQKVTITVVGKTCEISYILDEEEQKMLPTDAPLSYNTADLPFALPMLTKPYYEFVGWEIDGFEGVYKVLDENSEFDTDLILSPKWIFPHFDLSFSSKDVVIGIDDTTEVMISNYDLSEELLAGGFIYESSNPLVATVDSGLITGISDGYTEIKVILKNNQSINATIGLTVSSKINTMNEVLQYFASIAESSNIVKQISVVGWQKTYSYELRTSVIGYLFEDLNITENIAPETNNNRPGSKNPKYYITVHDTGDIEYSAKDWSMTVYNEFNEAVNEKYGASFQYVVDNDDVYHNIPDDEMSYHAGDGTSSYELIPSGIKGTNKYPSITITSDGYYAIDNQKTLVVAPTGKDNQILTTADINDCGIRCVLKNGEYYLGKTWYSSTYKKISNCGGNRNSIGIESCITKGDDIYYTWQRLAKLVAKLMDENNLTIDDVVPHHYFSGKNCPQTMRQAGMWEHFKSLVVIEYTVLQYLKAGYSVSFTSNDLEYVNNSGRVIKTSSLSKTISYQITVSKDGLSESITLMSTIMHKPINK